MFPTGLADKFRRDDLQVMGTVRSYARQAMAIQPFVQIEPAVEHIRNNFREQISVKGLAQLVSLSRRQFDRRLHRLARILRSGCGSPSMNLRQSA